MLDELIDAAGPGGLRERSRIAAAKLAAAVGDHAAAAEYYGAAADSHPDPSFSREARLNQAKALLAGDDLENARSALERLPNAGPDQPLDVARKNDLLKQANLWISAGGTREAVELLVENRPAKDDAAGMKEYVETVQLAQGRVPKPERLELLKTVSEHAGRHVTPRMVEDLSRLAGELDDPATAERVAKVGLRFFPNDGRAVRQIDRLRAAAEARGDIEEARDLDRRLMKLPQAGMYEKLEAARRLGVSGSGVIAGPEMPLIPQPDPRFSPPPKIDVGEE